MKLMFSRIANSERWPSIAKAFIVLWLVPAIVIPIWFWFFWNGVATTFDSLFFMNSVFGWPFLDWLIYLYLMVFALMGMSLYISLNHWRWLFISLCNIFTLSLWYVVEQSSSSNALLPAGVVLTITSWLIYIVFMQVFRPGFSFEK